jgi:hypothetical protein
MSNIYRGHQIFVISWSLLSDVCLYISHLNSSPQKWISFSDCLKKKISKQPLGHFLCTNDGKNLNVKCKDIHQTAVINWWQRSDDLWPCDRGHIETDCLSWISRKKDGEDQELIIQCNLSNEPLSTPYKVTNFVQSLLRFLSFLTSSIKVFVSSTWQGQRSSDLCHQLITAVWCMSLHFTFKFFPPEMDFFFWLPEKENL